jgi:hypothetical protein
MLASFLGVLPILTPPLCAFAFIMCFLSGKVARLDGEWVWGWGWVSFAAEMDPNDD